LSSKSEQITNSYGANSSGATKLKCTEKAVFVAVINSHLAAFKPHRRNPVNQMLLLELENLIATVGLSHRAIDQSTAQSIRCLTGQCLGELFSRVVGQRRLAEVS